MAKRILIADDSVTIQKAFAMTFAGEDVSIATARSADDALNLARQARPDIIIADGAMPGRTGYDLCMQVRAEAGLRGVPVYILASSQQPYDEGRGRNAGADGHLLKPWDTTQFIEKVYAAAGATAAVAPPPAPPPRAGAASLPASAMEDEDYGEISIDSSGPVTPLPVPTPVPNSAPAMAAAPRTTGLGMPVVGAPPVPGLRPSLIPGMRPGAVPPVRPGTAPARPLGGPAVPAPSPSLPPRPAAPPVGRTMIGLPAAGIPIPGAPRPSPSMPPMRSPTGPVAPLAPPVSPVMSFAPPPAPAPRPRAMTPMPPAMPPHESTVRTREMTPAPPVRPRGATPMPPASLVSAAVDQKMAAFAAKGPEYEAIAKLSREIIEQIVWEIVPELAEAIIRERVEKLNN
ncbi:MAG TPA: response regulator [Polyangia bacterium]|nr:response regulator [Polyangia bacterium]